MNIFGNYWLFIFMQHVIITYKFRYKRECRDGKSQHHIGLIISTIVTKIFGKYLVAGKQENNFLL